MEIQSWIDKVDVFNLGDIEFLRNSLQSWIASLVIASIVFVVLVGARSLLQKKFEAFSARTSTRLDDLFLDLTRQTRRVFLLVVSIYAGSLILEIPSGTQRLLRSVLVITLLVQVWFWGARLLSLFIRKAIVQRRGFDEKDTAIEGTIPAIEFIGRFLLFAIIVLLALDNLGFDVTALIASLGIGGIAVALALQNILGDLFASLSILFDKPFRVGDFVVVNDFAGTVEKIGLKTTRVRSLSGEQLVFSNADLLSSRIRNYKRMSERRIVFSIGVTYQTGVEKLKNIQNIIKNVIESIPDTRFDRAHFAKFGPSSLDFEVVYIVLTADYNKYMDIQQEINIRIYEKFSQEEIEFAHPTQTLFLEKTEGLVESLRNVGT